MNNCTGCPYLNKNIKKVCDTCHKIDIAPITEFAPIVPKLLKAKGRHKPGVMNKTEASYAQYLDLERFNVFSPKVLWWKFEGITLKLADDTRYTPDFAVLMDDGSFEFHETKHLRKQKDGTKKPHFEDDALAKIKIAAALFPFTFKSMWMNEQGSWEAREF